MVVTNFEFRVAALRMIVEVQVGSYSLETTVVDTGDAATHRNQNTETNVAGRWCKSGRLRITAISSLVQRSVVIAMTANTNHMRAHTHTCPGVVIVIIFVFFIFNTFISMTAKTVVGVPPQQYDQQPWQWW